VPGELISTHENTFLHYIWKQNHRWNWKVIRDDEARSGIKSLSLWTFTFWRFLGT